MFNAFGNFLSLSTFHSIEKCLTIDVTILVPDPRRGGGGGMGGGGGGGGGEEEEEEEEKEEEGGGGCVL